VLASDEAANIAKLPELLRKKVERRWCALGGAAGRRGGEARRGGASHAFVRRQPNEFNQRQFAV
jgi:hypothetical protein